MRLGAVVLVLLFAVFGATFGALNAERIALDLYLVDVEVPKGAALLAALLAGWVLGGLVVWTLRVPRLKREVRSARRTAAELRTRLESSEGTATDRA